MTQTESSKEKVASVKMVKTGAAKSVATSSKKVHALKQSKKDLLATRNVGPLVMDKAEIKRKSIETMMAASEVFIAIEDLRYDARQAQFDVIKSDMVKVSREIEALELAVENASVQQKPALKRQMMLKTMESYSYELFKFDHLFNKPSHERMKKGIHSHECTICGVISKFTKKHEDEYCGTVVCRDCYGDSSGCILCAKVYEVLTICDGRGDHCYPYDRRMIFDDWSLEAVYLNRFCGFRVTDGSMADGSICCADCKIG